VSNNRRITILISGLLVAATFVALFGLPFLSFSAMSVDAQYGPGPNADRESAVCGSKPEYQVRLRGGGVLAYVDSDLTVVAVNIPDSERQKYLLCTNVDTRAEGYVPIFFPLNKRLYVSVADVSDIVCRNLRDPETGLCQ
jgi:hypothetical protein